MCCIQELLEAAKLVFNFPYQTLMFLLFKEKCGFREKKTLTAEVNTVLSESTVVMSKQCCSRSSPYVAHNHDRANVTTLFNHLQDQYIAKFSQVYFNEMLEISLLIKKEQQLVD